MLEEKLQALRVRWKNEPENRRIIELQARLLKMGSGKKYAENDDELEAMIRNEIAS